MPWRLSLTMLGVSHRSAPLSVLERVALSAQEQESVLGELLAEPSVEDAMLLSTCNRTELYVAGLDVTPEALKNVLARVAGPDRLPDPQHFYDGRGTKSIEHLFRVSCGLDSLILGETQILGQVKDAYDFTKDHHPTSPYLDHIVQRAIKAAKRSRSETEIGKGAVSVASAAVHLATRIYARLDRCHVVVIGAGETGRIAAEHFAKHGPGRMTILNRTLEKAESLARRFDAEFGGLDVLEERLHDADIVASAVTTQTPILRAEILEKARHKHSGSIMALLDLGLPRNIDPAVESLGNVILHDIEALKMVVDANLSRRRAEIPKVESLIAEQVGTLLAWQDAQRAKPLIMNLRQSIDTLRATEVDKACKGLSDAEREAVDQATRAIINKLLHGPTQAIKSFAQNQEEGARHLASIKTLFSHLLHQEDDGKSDSES